MARLVEIGGGEGRTFELGDVTTIGRAPESHVLLSDPMTSLRHAEVRRSDDGGYSVVDLKSRHGTFLGGRRIGEATLAHGDEILIGPIRLRFESDMSVPKRDAGFRPAAEIANETALRRDYEKLRVAFELTRAIGVEPDVEALLERILAAAFQLLHAERGTLIILDEATRIPAITVARNRAGAREEMALSTSMISEVLSKKAGVLTHDAGADTRYARSGSVFAQNIRSAMCVPLLYQGDLFGLMHLDSQTTTGIFSEADLELFTAIANQAALAVKNAVLVGRLRAVEAEERRRLERVVQNLPSGVVLLDGEGRIRLANAYARELLGALGGAREGDALQALGSVAIERLVGAQVEIDLQGPPRRILVAGATRAADETLVVVRDVTAEREADERAHREDRLVLLGRLAGGITHDFNNLLFVILTYADLLASEATSAEMKDDALQLEDAARRAADLTRQLLTFSRREIAKPQVLDLGAVVQDMQRLWQRTIGEHVRVETDPGARSCIKADPSRIEQIVANLVVNARDAMPGGGTITIGTRDVELPEGRFVELRVTDTGVGMPPEVARRVFEPFFTTKAEKGTGLGLATVHTVVTQAGGRISLDTAPGQGTTFRVLLPATDELPGRAEEAAPAALAALAGRTILVAEDERQIRKLIRRILEESGCTVLEAGTGEEALRVAAAHAGPIDLVLADVVMPGMSGRELAARLAPLRDGIRVLYISGYLADEVQDELGAAVLLRKPFSRGELLGQIAAILAPGDAP